jgi:ATP-binding cassette subfamily C (CFTR/MRP) protein 1
MGFLPTLAAVLTFITYGLVEDSLDPATTFAAFQLFNIIQVPLQNLPASLTWLTDAWVAVGRVSDILLAEESDREVQITAGMVNAIEARGDFTFETSKPPENDKQPNTGGKDRKAEKLKKKAKAAAKRESKRRSKQGLPPLEEEEKKHEETEEDVPFTLRDIDLSIPKGAFVCIVGRIGAGKTALLQALLGDMRQIRGEVNFGGTVSFVSQQSWIQNATLRDNITFGDEVIDDVRLRNAIDTCALSRDIEQLAGGLDTEIGGKPSVPRSAIHRS